MSGKVASVVPPSNNQRIVYAPLKIYNPFSLVVFLSFFSPIILVASILSLSFMFQNFKGIIYLLFLLEFAFLKKHDVVNLLLKT